MGQDPLTDALVVPREFDLRDSLIAIDEPVWVRNADTGNRRRRGAGVGGMLGATQKLAPEEQALISSINSTDRATLIRMEPRQPNRLEKKRNINGHPCRPVRSSP